LTEYIFLFSILPGKNEGINIMKVKEILKKKEGGIITIFKDKTIDDAIILMNKHRIGALMVVDEDKKLVGQITRRDLLRVIQKLHNK